MGWLSRILRAVESPSRGSRLEWLTLDMSWGSEVERSRDRVVWIDADGDAFSLDLVIGSLGNPAALDLAVARKSCRELAEHNDGAILSVESIEIAGHPAIQLIYKREQPPGYAYTGMQFLQLGP